MFVTVCFHYQLCITFEPENDLFSTHLLQITSIKQFVEKHFQFAHVSSKLWSKCKYDLYSNCPGIKWIIKNISLEV